MGADDFETWEMEVDFKVREYPSGELWLLVEHWSGPKLPQLGESFLGLEFNKGTDLETAREVCRMLRQHVRGLTATGPAAEFPDDMGRGATRRATEELLGRIVGKSEDEK